MKEKAAIIVSSKDPAGINIKENLLKFFEETGETFEGSKIYKKGNLKLYTTKKDSILSENIDKKIDAGFFLFATKHQSAAGKESFTVHSIGNFGDAKYGGKNKELVQTNPNLVKELINKLKNKAKGTNHEITIEATHHGPYMEKPCTFIEIGSNKKSWENKDYGKIIAETITEVFDIPINQYKTFIVLGGSHYNHIANKILLETDYTIGHICPKHQLQNLDYNLLKQMKEKSNSDEVILDWKGLSQNKRDVIKLLEKTKTNYKKSKELFNKDSV